MILNSFPLLSTVSAKSSIINVDFLSHIRLSRFLISDRFSLLAQILPGTIENHREPQSHLIQEP